MNLSQVLLVLGARWRSALVVFLAVVALVVAVNMSLPKKYTATSSVVLDVKSPDPIAGVVLPGMTVSAYMGTQVDVLQSERVMLKAIGAMGTAKDAALRERWQQQTEGRGSFESWIAEGIARKLNVQPGKDSNVVLVSYTDRDPGVASTVANAVVKGYIETTLELRTEPAKQFSHQFDETTQNLRGALEEAQGRLSAFQKSSGIVATDERLDIENARLSELSSQMVVLQASLNESRGRQDQARHKGDQMQEVVTNQMIMNLSASLATQEARLKELGERLGEKHPQVQELSANITELRSRLNAERVRIAGSLTVNNSVNQSRLDELRSSLDQQRSKVIHIKTLRDEALVLQRDVENAQRAFDAGFARKSQSALESQATQTNVSVLKTASAPPFPSSPRIKLNVGVAMLLGIALALATAIFRERRDWRLRNDTDVFEVMKQPLLGVLPDGRRAQLTSGSRSLRSVAERVLGRPPRMIGQ
jgi:succinoglycan biosynthesis transport protein ExoP